MLCKVHFEGLVAIRLTIFCACWAQKDDESIRQFILPGADMQNHLLA